jgi:hypothetical protein
MGIGPGSRSRSTFEQSICSSRIPSYEEQSKLPNPNPSNYKIVKVQQIGDYLLMLINYPDCTNYEGNKILLYKDITLVKLLCQQKLDPHFCNNKKYHSPIARFEPTDFGWNCAITLMNSLGK